MPEASLNECGRITLTAVLLEGGKVQIEAESRAGLCPVYQYAKALGGISGVCVSGMKAVVEQCEALELEDVEILRPAFEEAVEKMAKIPTKFTKLHGR